MNRQSLPFDRHAANEYGGWVKIAKRFRPSHKPMGLVSLERVTVSIINNNFTFIYLSIFKYVLNTYTVLVVCLPVSGKNILQIPYTEVSYIVVVHVVHVHDTQDQEYSNCVNVSEKVFSLMLSLSYFLLVFQVIHFTGEYYFLFF